MATAATIAARLTLDTKAYDSALKTVSKKTSETAMNIGAAMTRAGAAMTAGLTLPIVGAGIAATKMAVDLQESQNAVNVVFGESAEIISQYGDTVAQTAGLSQAEFNQLSAVTGAFLKNVGFDAAEAANETIKLTERASDMASIFNTDVSQALNAIQSGLKGEFNPLEQFGVKLNAAAIEARALAMGLADADGNISDSAKSTAALALVMEQTEQFAGDFAATSGDLANATKIAKAEFTDAAAALGTNLLPIGLKIVEFLSGLIDKFNALTPEQQKNILVVLGIVAAIGPLVTIIGGLITAFGAIIPVVTAIAGVLTFPLIAIILAVVAVVAFLAAAWKNNWGGIQEKVAEAVKFIKIRFTILKIIFMRWFDIVRTLFEAFQAAFSGDWRLFGEKLREAWDKAWQLIKDIVNTAWDVLRGKIVEIVVNIVKFFTDTDWKQVGIDIVTGIGNGLASMMTWLADAARNVAQAALDAAKGFLGISSPSKAFGELGKFSAIGFGEAFTDTMAGFNPEMNMAMAGGFGGVSVPGAGSVGGGGGSNDSLMHEIQRMMKSLPDDLKRANKDLISKLGKR